MSASRTSIRRALYGRMSGDTTLNGLLGSPASGYAKAIYHYQAPEGARYPYVIFFKSSGMPTEAFTNPAVMQTDVWTVKAVDHNTSADTAEAVADRITALLNDATLSISGGTLLYLRRQGGDINFPEIADGEAYIHVGSLYRLVSA